MRITSAEDLETAADAVGDRAARRAVGQLGHQSAQRSGPARDQLHRLELVADRIARDPGTLDCSTWSSRDQRDARARSLPLLPRGQTRPSSATTARSTPRCMHWWTVSSLSRPDGVAIRVENGGARLGWSHLIPRVMWVSRSKPAELRSRWVSSSGRRWRARRRRAQARPIADPGGALRAVALCVRRDRSWALRGAWRGAVGRRYGGLGGSEARALDGVVGHHLHSGRRGGPAPAPHLRGHWHRWPRRTAS